jgi:hypothetical protein
MTMKRANNDNVKHTLCHSLIVLRIIRLYSIFVKPIHGAHTLKPVSGTAFNLTLVNNYSEESRLRCPA